MCKASFLSPLCLFIFSAPSTSGSWVHFGILIETLVHRAFYQQTFALTLAEYCRHPAPLDLRAFTCALSRRWSLFVLYFCSFSAVVTLLVTGLGSGHWCFYDALGFGQLNFHLIRWTKSRSVGLAVHGWFQTWRRWFCCHCLAQPCTELVTHSFRTQAK